MPQFHPIGGNSQIDYPNLNEAVNAIQRNSQFSRQIGVGAFTAYAIYAVIVPTGTAVIYDTTAAYTITAPGMNFMPSGIPLAFSPGPTGTNVSSSAAVTVVYK